MSNFDNLKANRWSKDDEARLLDYANQLSSKEDLYKLVDKFPGRSLDSIRSKLRRLNKNPAKNLNNWDKEDLKLMAKLYMQDASIKEMQEAISVEATLDEIEDALNQYMERYRKQVQAYAEEHKIALRLPITSTKLKAFYQLKDKTGFHKQALKHKLESYG